MKRRLLGQCTVLGTVYGAVAGAAYIAGLGWITSGQIDAAVGGACVGLILGALAGVVCGLLGGLMGGPVGWGLAGGVGGGLAGVPVARLLIDMQRLSEGSADRAPGPTGGTWAV